MPLRSNWKSLKISRKIYLKTAALLSIVIWLQEGKWKLISSVISHFVITNGEAAGRRIYPAIHHRSPSLPASLDRLKAQSSEGYKYKNVKIRLRRLNNLYDIF